MYRRDYENLAEILNQTITEELTLAEGGEAAAITRFADELEEKYDNFDKARFLDRMAEFNNGFVNTTISM